MKGIYVLTVWINQKRVSGFLDVGRTRDVTLT